MKTMFFAVLLAFAILTHAYASEGITPCTRQVAERAQILCHAEFEDTSCDEAKLTRLAITSSTVTYLAELDIANAAGVGSTSYVIEANYQRSVSGRTNCRIMNLRN